MCCGRRSYCSLPSRMFKLLLWNHLYVSLVQTQAAAQTNPKWHSVPWSCMCASLMYLWRIYGRITGLRIPLFLRCLIIGCNSTQHFIRIFWITTSFQVKQQWCSILPHEGLISRFIAEILCSFVVFFDDWLVLVAPHAALMNEWRLNEWISAHDLLWWWFGDGVSSNRKPVQQKQPTKKRNLSFWEVWEDHSWLRAPSPPSWTNLLLNGTCWRRAPAAN